MSWRITNSESEIILKLLVIGDYATGKTSIIRKYVHGQFSSKYKATIGVDFAVKEIKIENKTVRLQLWDIAGQERFGQMTRVYYQGAVGALLVFDVTRSSTFESVIKWKEDLDSKVHSSEGEPVPVVLIANKVDLLDEEWADINMDLFTKRHGFIDWFYTSAKEGTNLIEASSSLVKWILQTEVEPENTIGSGFPPENDSGFGCC